MRTQSSGILDITIDTARLVRVALFSFYERMFSIGKSIQLKTSKLRVFLSGKIALARIPILINLINIDN